MKFSLRRLSVSPWIIFGAALAYRLAVLYLVWHRMPPSQPNVWYGYETGRIAAAIASGEGFSSPLLPLKTGPTAFLCPIYPYLLAGIFKMGGVYSIRSHVIAQILNCLFVALTVFPIYAIALRTFGIIVAVFASWLWVILPTALHMPIAYVWDTSLFTLCFALLFLATLALRGERRFYIWGLYGLLWSVCAMINATCLSVFPFFMAWLIGEARTRRVRWIWPASAALLVFSVGVTPWTIRNYLVFGRFVPVRSAFGMQLWEGNNPVAVDADSLSMTAIFNRTEAQKYQQLGEIAYMRELQSEAVAFMRSHPGETSHRILRRIGKFWFGATDRPNNTWSLDPLYLKALVVSNVVFVLLGFLGAAKGWRSRSPGLPPYWIVLFVFPLVYYLTATFVRYRFTIDPILTVLASNGVASTLVWLRSRDEATPSTPSKC